MYGVKVSTKTSPSKGIIPLHLLCLRATFGTYKIPVVSENKGAPSQTKIVVYLEQFIKGETCRNSGASVIIFAEQRPNVVSNHL